MTSSIPKKILIIYTISNGLSHMVHDILRIAFTITLFEIDKRGVAGSYLTSASLLGIMLAGFGGVLLKRFSCYAIGIYAPILEILTLLHVCVYNSITTYIYVITFVLLFCITSIEHSNSFALINNKIPNYKKPLFISTLQITTYCFSIFASITTKYLLQILGLKLLIVCCICIYILRVILWQLLQSIGPNIHTVHKHGILTGFKEIINNSNLLYSTIFRIMIHIAITTYVASLPITVAKIAHKNSHTYGELYSKCSNLMNIGFLISNIIGLWIFKKRAICITHFPTISSIILVLTVTMSLHTLNSYWLQTTAVSEGIGLFLFKSSNMLIIQALVTQEKLPFVMLAGDAIVRTCAYIIGCFIPKLIFLCPIQGIFPPLTILVMICFFIAIRALKFIDKIYLQG